MVKQLGFMLITETDKAIVTRMDIPLIAFTWAFYCTCLAVFVYFFVTNWLLVAGLALAYIGLQLYREKRAKVLDIRGRGVLITGCDTGFGHSLSRHLAECGVTVFAGVLDDNSHGAKELLRTKSRNLHVIKLDVTKGDEVQNAVDFITSKNKGLWGVVSNAGMNFPGEVEFLSMEQILKVANVNLYGGVRVIKAVLPLIRTSKGRVVIVSSARGRYSWPTESAYNMTKHGIETFADTLRMEMYQFGVKVCVVEPGDYDGATSIMSPHQLRRIKTELETMWDQASDEVKEVYGRGSIDNLYDKRNTKMSNIQSFTDAPVVNALHAALTQEDPVKRCLIGGTSGLVDIINVYAAANPFLPTEVTDFIAMVYAGYGLKRRTT